MMHRATPTAKRAANFTPSVERGRYRVRLPSTASRKLFAPRAQSQKPPAANAYLAVSVILLAAACVTSFCFAYYLFTTRFAVKFVNASHSPPDDIQVVDFESGSNDFPLLHPNEKFLTYLPHSGFHNQRIALENALVLGSMLNRTLLAPPARLGSHFGYFPFDLLRRFLSVSYKDDLHHCASTFNLTEFPTECFGYFDYTHISWDWLADLTDIRRNQRFIQRWNMTDDWLKDHLQLSQEDQYFLRDKFSYHYRFVDTASEKPTKHKYTETLQIQDLASSSHHLMQLGTLFGSARLRLRTAEARATRERVRSAMAFSNPLLDSIADAIQSSLGSRYYSVHLRLEDGTFARNGSVQAKSIWLNLLRNVLRYSETEIGSLEKALNAVNPELWFDRRRSTRSKLRCRGHIYTDQNWQLLNSPIFIATDANDPMTHEAIQPFLKTFPCAFVLTDFATELSSIDHLTNGRDGVRLKKFILPFLDAMVAGRATRVVGTPGSTFSGFIEDVLWRKYHGLAITQRG